MPRKAILDHIVILVSESDLATLPERLESSLTVIDGGEHADGCTINKLIILPDGVYIELIAFRDSLDPGKRREHRWGQQEEHTIVDWAQTLHYEEEFAEIQQRVQGADADGITYHDPIPGGRTRPEGIELQWAISSAQNALGEPLPPGTAPFWCFDKTPRRLRVPYQGDGKSGAPEHTQHPSGAQGISQVLVSVPGEEQYSTMEKVYDAVHGTAIGGGEWSFLVPSTSERGKHRVALRKSRGNKREVSLTLVGTEDSPSSIDILPGLTVHFEK